MKVTRSSSLRGRPAVTVSGQRLGEITDVLVDAQNGAFAGLEVAGHRFGGLRTSRVFVRATEDIRIGPDVVIVPDGIADDGDHGEQEGEHAPNVSTSH
jgi:uncharacterized protein YrrD